jgi:hypothetical protein
MLKGGIIFTTYPFPWYFKLMITNKNAEFYAEWIQIWRHFKNISEKDYDLDLNMTTPNASIFH